MVIPENRPSVSRSTLPQAIRHESISDRRGPSGVLRAAIAWGMPVPSVPGKQRSRSCMITSMPSVMTIMGRAMPAQAGIRQSLSSVQPTLPCRNSNQ